jgi:nitrite reductase (NADH) small subunit
VPTATEPQSLVVDLCDLEQIPLGLGRAFDVGGLAIAVFRTRGGRIYAIEGTCPHRGAPLADGIVTGDRVVCPYHAYRYALTDGQCDQQSMCGVKTYPASISAGRVMLTLNREPC